MGNEWSYIHRAIRKQGIGVNTEIQYESDAKRQYVYGSHPDQRVTYYMYRNVKYLQTIHHARRKIKELLKLGNKPKYYCNFVMIGDETFNGITETIVDELKKEIYVERKREELRKLNQMLEGDE